jgi:hypothetical protein
MLKSILIIFASTLLLLASLAGVNAQSFSCPIGKTPACLDPGANVCTGTAKCVANNAVCFNSRSCDSKGFVCKSRLDESSDSTKRTTKKYNLLMNEKDGLLAEIAKMKVEIASLNTKIERAQSKQDLLELCVSKSESLDEALICRRL